MQKAIRGIRRVLVMAATGLAAMAIVQQIKRPRPERTWHGKVLGVPYDFRPPTLARLREKWWNVSGPLFTPHTFGVGWSLNLYRLTHLRSKPAEL